MSYNPKTLESQASSMKFFAVFSGFGRAAIFAFVYFVCHTLNFRAAEMMREFAALMPHIRPIPPLVDNLDTVKAAMIFWATIGFASSLGKMQRAWVEANLILCQVEQEKHLRHLASAVIAKPD